MPLIRSLASKYIACCSKLIAIILLLSQNPTARASIGEPCALAYTSCTAYVSYI